MAKGLKSSLKFLTEANKQTETNKTLESKIFLVFFGKLKSLENTEKKLKSVENNNNNNVSYNRSSKLDLQRRKTVGFHLW